MSLPESDLDLLQTYLDGALPTGECEELWRRIAAEPEMAGQLEELRAQRQARQAIFTAMEPDERAVENFNRSVAASVRRVDFLAALKRGLTMTVGAAAILLFGFTVGFLIRSHYPIYAPPNGTSDNLKMVQDTRPEESPEPGGKFVVEITDQNGQVIATQRVNSLQQARELADDVSRNQAMHRDAREQMVVPVSDQY